MLGFKFFASGITKRFHPLLPAVDHSTLSDDISEQLAIFSADEAKAQALLKTGDSPRDEKLPAARVATAAVVVNGLLNFDGSVMKR